MMEKESPNALGRKVFFLHPSALTQNQIITELAQEEFEVYIIKDEGKLKGALELYPNSILFASINEGMKEGAWEELIKTLTEKGETTVDIGIIASANSELIQRKYTGLYKVKCGFTVLKSDFSSAIRQLISALNAVNAKGRRKYIRLIMEKETNVSVNLPMNGTFINGIVKDISVVGFSFVFKDEIELAKNGLFGDIQLKLQSQLLKAEGIVFGSRIDGNEKVYVILFTQRVDPEARAKIRKYIHSNLQNRLEQELK
jgi:hypothetical protein